MLVTRGCYNLGTDRAIVLREVLSLLGHALGLQNPARWGGLATQKHPRSVIPREHGVL